jgi:hypothetical protein
LRGGIKNLLHPMFRPEFATALVTLYHTVFFIVMLSVCVKFKDKAIYKNGVHLNQCSLRREFVGALGAFKAVFCVVVLEWRQETGVKLANGHGPDKTLSRS